jgi:hypothetical protein
LSDIDLPRDGGGNQGGAVFLQAVDGGADFGDQGVQLRCSSMYVLSDRTLFYERG